MPNSHLSDDDKEELVRRFGKQVCFNIPLSEISRWKIGGIADVIVSPRNTEELSDLRGWIFKKALPSVVIGATSNLLFADQGLRAIAIHIGSSFSAGTVEGCHIVAKSGTWVPRLARKAMLAGLSGLEHTSGIPGTLGGLVYMNGGSQRKGIGNNITYVKSIDEQGQVVIRTSSECKFAYRSSIFQNLNEVIVEVGLELDWADDKNNVRKDMLSIMRSRRKKFPQKLPNCGSVFVSHPKMYELVGPPGRAIEECGLKGLSEGNAQVSMIHANFIVNNGGATAEDVLRLIRTVGKKVYAETGFVMLVEARYVSPEGKTQDINFL